VTGKRKTKSGERREDRRVSSDDDYGYLPVFFGVAVKGVLEESALLWGCSPKFLLSS
tara:strand:- start:736 stop:906 length:171 start_codon:yes stop_codon:yes gene_type:complete